MHELYKLGPTQLPALLTEKIYKKIILDVWTQELQSFFSLPLLRDSIGNLGGPHRSRCGKLCRCYALRKNSSLIREARSLVWAMGKAYPCRWKFYQYIPSRSATTQTNFTILACFTYQLVTCCYRQLRWWSLWSCDLCSPWPEQISSSTKNSRPRYVGCMGRWMRHTPSRFQWLTWTLPIKAKICALHIPSSPQVVGRVRKTRSWDYVGVNLFVRAIETRNRWHKAIPSLEYGSDIYM